METTLVKQPHQGRIQVIYFRWGAFYLHWVAGRPGSSGPNCQEECAITGEKGTPLGAPLNPPLLTTSSIP